MDILKKNNILWIAIAALIGVLLFVSILLYKNKEIASFEIMDRCGAAFNNIMHTISSKEVCQVRCKSQCEAMEYRLLNFEFDQSDTRCNSCRCSCKS